MTGAVRRAWRAAALGCAGAIALFAAAGVSRADDFWQGGTSTDWFDAANWSAGSVPTSADTEHFDSTATSLTISLANTTDGRVGALVFDATAPAFTFEIGSGGSAPSFLTITGAGITDNGANAPTFTLVDAGFGETQLNFGDHAVNGLAAPTAGDAIINSDGAVVTFNEHATAGNAVITQTGASGLNFLQNSSAGSATMNGFIQFGDSADGGNATINDIVQLNMSGTSSLGNATVTTSSGSINFFDNANGGNAIVDLGSGASLNLQFLTASGISLGSLTGSGAVNLDSKSLTVGAALGASDVAEFSGTISGTDGSLLKDGDGTWILDNTPGAYSYTHATTVNGGTLQVDGDISSSSGISTNGSVTISGSGTLPYADINSGSTLAPGTTSSVGTINLASDLHFHESSILLVDVIGSDADRATVAGAVTISAATTLQFAPDLAAAGTYTILSATGGITGTFGTVDFGSGFGSLSASVIYQTNAILLQLDEPPLPTFNWTGASSNDWDDAANWSDTEPGSGQTAVFGATGDQTIFFTTDATTTVGGLQFDASADAFDFELNPGSGAGTKLVIDGDGIVDNSAFFPIIDVITSDAAHPSELDFTNSATAGDASIGFDGPLAIIRFQGNSTAEFSEIVPLSPDAVSEIHFEDSSHAGNALIFANSLYVSGTASLDTAGIEIGENGLMQLDGASDGAQAEVFLDDGSVLDITGHDPGTVGLGSIDGSGTIELGDHELSLDMCGCSPHFFDGTIEDFAAGTHGAIGVGGDGIWILGSAGTYTYTGQTTVYGAELEVDGDISSSSGVVVQEGVLSGYGTVPSTTVHAGGTFSPGGDFIDTLTVHGDLTLLSGAFFEADIDDFPSSDLADVSGAVALDGELDIFLDPFSTFTAGMHYTLIQGASIGGDFPSMVVYGSLDAGLGIDRGVIGDTYVVQIADALTWKINPGSTAFGTGANWFGGVAPSFGDAAVFGTSSVTTIDLANGVILGSMTFAGDAFTFNLAGSNEGYAFTGAGIVNNASGPQQFNLTGSGATLDFDAAASAGDTHFDISAPGAAIRFRATASADTAVFDASGAGSYIAFNDSTSAASADITLGAGATLIFFGASDGGSATVETVAGALVDVQSHDAGTITLGSISGGGDVHLGANTLSLGALDTDMTISGVIDGSGGLTKTGAGTLTLTGANTYTGTTTISDGELKLGTGGSIDGDVVDDALLRFAGSDDYTFAHAISGGGTVRISGSGVTTLSGSNSYTGGTYVESGATLSVLADDNIGPGSLTFFPNSTLVFGAGGSYTHDALFATGAPVFDTAGNTVTYAGQLTGGGDLTVIGGGTLILTNTTNSYSGGTFVQDGATVEVDADSELGDTAGGVTLGDGASAGTLKFDASFDLDGGRSFTVEAGGGAIDTNSFDTTLAQAIAGSGDLEKRGAGTLFLTGTSGYGGTLNVTGGTLDVSGIYASAAVAVNGGVLTGTGEVGAVHIASGGTLQENTPGNELTVDNALTFDSGSTFEVTVDGASPGGIIANGAVTLAGALVVNVTPDIYTAGVPYALISSASAVSGTFDEGETFNGSFGHFVTHVTYNDHGNGVFLTLSEAPFNWAANPPGVANWTDTASWDAGLVPGSGDTAAFGATTNANPIVSAGNVVSLAEMDFLAGAPAYTIVVDGSGGDASFTLDGGAGIVDSSSQAPTIVAQGDVAGVGSVYLLAGSLGDAHVRVHDGGAVTLDAASSAGTADIAMDGGSLQFLGTVDASSASLTLDGGSMSVATASALTIGSLEGGTGGAIDLSADLIIANGGSKSYGGSITGAHSVTLQSFTLILTASMAYTGGTNVLGGGEIDLGDTTGGHDGNLAGDVALSNGGNLKFNWAAAHEFGGVFSGQGTVLVNGPGKVTLTGDSAAFNGNTFVFSGATLQLGNGGTSGMIAHSIFGDVDATLILDHGVGGGFELPGTVGLGTVHQVGAAYVAFTSDLIVNTSLIIDSATEVRIGNGGTTGTLTGDVTDNGLLVFDRSDASTYAGNIVGAGGVQIGLNGAGTITFSGTSNSYSGSTQIEASATLKAGAANVFSANSRVVLCDCATLDLADHSQTIGGLTGGGHVLLGSAASTTLTFAGNAIDYFGGVISGAGKVTLIGSDAVVFTNANAYSGITTIGSDVTFVLGDDPFHPVQGSVAGDIVDNGAIALELSGTTNIAGAISGSGGLFKLGSGTVTTLGGANTYSGDTDIQAGTLRATSSGSFSANSRVIVEDIFGNSILDLNGHDSTIAGLSGDGAVLLSAHLTTGTSSVFDQFDGTFTGGGGLTEAAGGTLVLTGNYNDIGATTVNGVLSFAGTGAHAPNGGVTVSLGGELIGAADTLTLSFVTGPGDFSVEGGRTIITDVVDGTLSHVTVQSNGILQISDGPSGANLESNVLLQGSASQLVFARFGSISYDGVISGGGSVTQSGLSQLLFRNNNTYSGTTTIASGSLQVGQNGTTGSIGAGNIVDNGALTFSRSNALTVANLISGSGSFTQNGDGVLTLTNAANSYSGGTSVLDGVLSVAADSALGAAGGAVLLNSGTLRFSNAVIGSRNYSIFNNATFDVRANSQIGGNITGSGRLTKTGSAVLELLGSGDNWTGGTTISAGTLQIGAGGSITGNVTDNATLDFATSLTFGGQISGTGAVKVSSGTVFLTNDNSYSGGTTVTAVLEIGNGGTTGSIIGNVTNNGTLSFFRSDSLSFGGSISGSGILNKLAGGTLTLTGTNTYSGDTNITGTLIASGGAAIGDASVVTIFAGATLNLASNESVGAISSNGGTAAIALNANTLTLAGSFLTHWFGQMTGTGGLTLVNNGNTHVLLMGGTNTYSGATHIDSGEISADAANGFSPFAAVTVAAGATLDLNGYNETIGSLAGAGAVTLTTVNGGNGVLTTNGDNSSTLFSGAFSGVGGLTKVGTGTLTLTGDSSFTGSTIVTAGTLQLGNGGTTGSLTGDISDNGVLSFDRSDTLTFAGAITGSGALKQIGSGTTILTGVSTYGGGTTISAGTLQIGTGGSITGNVTDNANLAFNRSDAIDFAGLISGSGRVTQSGGTTTLSNASNSYGGGTFINAGILAISADGNLGAANGAVTLNGGTLQLNGSGPFYHSPSTRNFVLGTSGGTLDIPHPVNIDGVISGSGALTVTGAASLALVGDNTYTGGTIVHGDGLFIGFGGTTGSILGNVALGSDASHPALFAFQRTDDITFDGVISGWGVVGQFQTGKLTLTGNNTFVGAAEIQPGNGTLAVGADVNLGNASNIVELGHGATLQFLGSFSSTRTIQVGIGGSPGNDFSIIDTHGNAVSLSGVVSGGSLSKAGAGTLTLSGTNTYGGATTVDGGTLAVNGSIAASSGVTVNSGGTLGGTGTVGVTTVASGGTLAPGNSIGTLHIGGDLTLALGSHYVVEVSSSAADEALVAGAVFISGDLTLVASGALAAGHYTLINATGALSGTFSAVTLSGVFTGFTTNVTYDSHDVFLDVVLQGFQWQANPGSGDWNTGANWVPGTMPTAADNTIFDASTVTTVTVNQTAATNRMIFNAGAPGYTFDIAGTAAGDASLTVNGGIDDASSNRPSFAVSGSGGHSGTLTFADLTSGDAMLTVNAQGTIAFTGTADGAGSQIHVNTGGTLTIAGVSDGGASIGSIEGVGGTVDLGAKTLTVGGLNTTTLFTGTIIGAGTLIKTGSGTLILTGASTYTGGTTISQGTLQIGLGGASGSLAGDIVDNATLAFDRSDSFVFAGVVSGSGSVQQSGSGTTTLTGANTYGGGTVITAGTLQLGNGGASGSLTGAVADNGTLAFKRSDTVAFSGTISGSGGLVQAGTGVTALTADSTYTGGTLISAGTLALGDGSSAAGSVAGGIVDNATLSSNHSGIFTLANLVSGSGAFVQAGGTTIFTNDNSYAGGTTIAAGTLQLGNGGTAGSFQGAVADNGTLAFNRSDTITFGPASGGGAPGSQFGGVISGTGNVVQSGTGTTILTASNTYTGGTTITAGTLQLGDGGTVGSILGGVVDNSTLAVKHSDTLIIAGAISGSGAFVQKGSGTTILTGANTYAGPTTIAAGTLQIGNGGATGTVAGAITDNGTLIVDRAGVLTLGGVISGSGSLVKSGSGTLTLAALDTYTGPTTVNAGTLSVDGSISASTVTVNSGGTLGGTGTVGTTTVAGGGTLAAGDSIGTLHVAGDLTLASGSHLVAEIGPAANDEVLASGAVLLGGDLTLAATGGSYSAGQYTLINSGGALSGTFSSLSVAGSFGGYDVSLLYDAHDVILVLDLNGVRWSANPGSQDWNTGANWLIGTVPSASDKAFFGASTVTTVNVNQATSIAGMNFGAGAPAYTFNVAGTAAGNASLTVGGTGINDGSGNRPAFVVGGAAGNTGTLTFAGASSGDAMLSVGPLGTVAFTGAANGGTSQAVINAGGTLSIAGLSNGGMAIGSIEGGGTIQLGANTLTEGGINSSTLFSGTILGSGALVKSGSGTLTLTGANGYSGGTTIAAGTVQIGNGGTTGTVAGDVVDNGMLAFNRSDAVTFAGAISGTGDVQQAGSGTTILTGANSYTGTTIITAGTLQVGAGGTAGVIESTAAVNDNGALVYDVANDRTLAAAITGTGSLALTGSATITLTGANDYAGGTTISSGRLQIGNGGFSGAITGAVNDNGVLAFNRADLLIFDGVVSGGGALQQNGFGITALTAANTYTGGTTVSSGVLVLGFNGTSGSIAGNVLDNAQFAIFRSDVYTFGGVISGSGQFLDAGTGTAILTGDSNYAGGTSILLGAGTLQLGNGGTTGSIVGDVADEGVFAIDRSDTLTFGGTISGGGAFAQTGAGKTILTAANSYSGGTTIASGTLQLGNGGIVGSIAGDITDNGTLTFDRSNVLTITSVISGSGAVQQIGGGTTVLLGANTYTGGTTIASGILQIGDGNTTGSIVGNVADNGLLVIARSDAFAFAGAITGTGSLTQGGGGVTTLSGASTYSGATLVDAGTLQAGAAGAFSASSAHTVSLSATLDLNGFNETVGSLAGAGQVTLGSATLTAGGDNSSTLFSGVIAGGGGLIKAGTGTFVLSGDNSYAGGTTISGGTLELGNGTSSGSILGNIVDNGTLSLHRSDNVLFSATISGSGALVQKGPGMTALAATNTYSGGTTIQGGMLILGNGGTVGSIAGNVADNAAFAFNRTDNLTFAGVISGTGSVTKYNGNTLILTANNSYSGGTTIAGGTLQLGNGGASGAIVGDVADNGTLTIDRSDTLTLAGVISGAGGLNQIGTGMTVLSGISPYSGPTVVSAGILDVNGSIANSAVVLNGGTLKGNGTIGSLTVLGGSNVSPGNSIGTLNVAGSIGFAAGTTYAVEINAAGLSDRINAGGQAILAGGTVQVTAAPGNYALVTTYRIINAAGGVSGTFSSVTVDLPFFDASLLYGMSNVDLVLRAKTVDFTNLGLTPNELAAGGGVNAGTFNSDLYKAFLNQPSTAFIPAALDALSGEIHPTLRTALLEDSRNIRQAILDRLRQSNSGAQGLRGQNDARPLTDSVTMWLRVFSNWGQADTDHNAGTAERNYSGVVAGIDTSVVGALRLGLAGGYTHSDVTVTSRASKARAGGGHVAAYAGWNSGALALRTGAEYAWGNATVTRTVQFPGFLNNTSDVERQHSTQAFAEAGYALRMDRIALEPFAGFAWVNASTGAFHETGGIAALSGNSAGNAVTYSNLGLRLATAPMGSDVFAITPRLTLAWQHAFGAVLPGQSVTFQSTNQSFLVLGVPLDRDALATQLGVDIQLTPAGHLDLGYEGVLSSRVRSHAIRADLSWTF